MKAKKKLLSFLVCIAMVLALIPVDSLAIKASDLDTEIVVEEQAATEEVVVVEEATEAATEEAVVEETEETIEATEETVVEEATEADIVEEEVEAVGAIDPDYGFDEATGVLTIKTEDGLEKYRDSLIGKDAVKSVVVKSAVEKITYEYFKNMPNLESVTFEGDIEVADYNFYNCPSLKTVTFKGTSYLHEYAFSENVNMSKVTFAKPTKIKEGAFYNYNSTNTAMTSITFPAGSDLNESNVCQGFTALKSVTFEGDVKLRWSAFYNCKALETVTFKGTSELRDGAFQSVPKLKTLTFAKATLMRNGAFNTSFEDDFNTALTTLVIPAGSDLSESSAFYNFKALKSVTFNGDIVLEQNSFSYCSALETVTFKGTSDLSDGAFYMDPKIKTITFGKKTSLSDGAFLVNPYNEIYNNSLTSITFPAGSTFNSNYSGFMGFHALKNITFKGDVKIGQNMFSDLPELETVTFEGESYLCNGSFEMLPKVKKVTFGKKTTIEEAAFFNDAEHPNTALKELTFPDGSVLKEYGISSRYGRFVGYDGLEKITFEGDVTFDGVIFYSEDSEGLQPLKSLNTLVFKGKTPPTFPEKMLGVYDPDNFTIVANCAYRVALEEDPVNEQDELIHNAAFVKTVTGKHTNTCGHGKYKIIKGDNSVYELGTEEDVNIVSDADFDKFVSVKVNDEVLDPENYEAVSGSTDVTFKAEYLESLAPGKYGVEIESVDGSAYTILTIKAAADEMTDETDDAAEKDDDAPKTGDHAYPFVVFAIMMGAAWVSVMAAKKRSEKEA